MRWRELALLAVVPWACAHPAPRAAAHDPAAVHGMLLFGEKTLYLSHLPLFHRPHDWQLVFEAKVDDAARARYLADRAASKSDMYTFVPERFRLSELTEGHRTFSGDVVRGHFERGGSEIDRGVTVVPGRVVTARHLEPAGKRQGSDYLLFGGPDEAFAVHVIAAPPDFDQVVAVAPPADLSADELGRGVALRASQAGPLPASGEVAVTLPGGRAARLTILRQVYLELGDLAE